MHLLSVRLPAPFLEEHSSTPRKVSTFLILVRIDDLEQLLNAYVSALGTEIKEMKRFSPDRYGHPLQSFLLPAFQTTLLVFDHHEASQGLPPAG